MSDYLSGQVTFSGLGSGTDFSSVISKLVEVEGSHKRQMESWKKDWQSKMGAVDQLNTSMSSLRTTLDSMKTMNTFMVKNVSGTDSTVLTATASSDAEVTTHSIEVEQLAKNSIWISQSGVSTPDAPIVPFGETFSYSYFNPAVGQNRFVEVNLRPQGSLSELVNLINSDPNNPGVKASIITNGGGNFLQVRGLDLGSNATLGIYTPTMGLLGQLNKTQTNQDALLKINGWPSAANQWIHSSSNSVTSAIPGLTLTLKDSGTTQLTVNPDNESIKENVRTFVNKFNDVRAISISLTKVDTSKKQGSIMTGNYGVQLVDSNLKVAVASVGKGFLYYSQASNAGDPFSTLSQLGILTDAEEGSPTKGLLSLDETKLDAALLSNASAVAELFAADGIGGQVNYDKVSSFSYYSRVKGITKPGIYETKYSINSAGEIENATIAGRTAYIDPSTNLLTAASGDAQGIAIKVNNFSPGTYSGKVLLKQGKNGEISDMLHDYTNGQTGPLYVIKNNYQDIVDNIDKKIEYEQKRLDKMANTLKMQYSRLDAVLGRYGEIQKALTSGIAQMTSSK